MSQTETLAQRPLETVVPLVCRQVALNSSWLDGAGAAVLARRLIAAEVAPGGPYRDSNGHIDVTLNKSVLKLAALLGIRLVGLERFFGTPTGESRAVEHGKPTYPQLSPSNKAQRRAARIISGYRQPLRGDAAEHLTRMIDVDRSGELSRLAEFFAQSLSAVPKCDFTALGAANLLTWIAYTAYDAIVDNKAGASRILPIANATHRDAYLLYVRQCPGNLDSGCAAIFRAMDAANSWEMSQCRFNVTKRTMTIGRLPQYGNYAVLARRAAAHVLGPLIISRHAGVSPEQARDIKKALYEYLIARQLNDDLHDWAEDVINGHISPVVCHLIERTHLTGECSLEELMKRMRECFWQTGLETMSREALRSIKSAETRLLASGLMAAGTPFITEILDPIRKSLEKGLARHERDKQFYLAYRSP